MARMGQIYNKFILAEVVGVDKRGEWEIVCGEGKVRYFS